MSAVAEHPKVSKPKWKPDRKAALPEARTCTQAEAIALLRRDLFDAAVKAGWLQPCCEKLSERGTVKKIYAVAAVRQVEARVLAGEYPGQ